MELMDACCTGVAAMNACCDWYLADKALGIMPSEPVLSIQPKKSAEKTYSPGKHTNKTGPFAIAMSMQHPRDHAPKSASGKVPPSTHIDGSTQHKSRKPSNPTKLRYQHGKLAHAKDSPHLEPPEFCPECDLKAVDCECDRVLSESPQDSLSPSYDEEELLQGSPPGDDCRLHVGTPLPTDSEHERKTIVLSSEPINQKLHNLSADQLANSLIRAAVTPRVLVTPLPHGSDSFSAVMSEISSEASSTFPSMTDLPYIEGAKEPAGKSGTLASQEDDFFESEMRQRAYSLPASILKSAEEGRRRSNTHNHVHFPSKLTKTAMFTKRRLTQID